MKTVSALKQDLEFNGGLASLIGVLKNIAVSQYHAMESRAKSFEKLKSAIYSFLEIIDPRQVAHPFLNPRNEVQMVVAVTSDSGLLGGLNKEVIDAALAELAKIPGRLVVIGERGKMYARETKTSCVAFPGIKEGEIPTLAMQLRNYVLGKFIEESLGHLKVVYPRSISFTVQRIETVAFLPFRLEARQSDEPPPLLSEVILESLPADVVEYCVYLWIEQKLAEIFAFSKLAEYAARFSHLERSAQRLKEMDQKLKMQYFRVRHEIIDRNMRELFATRQIYAS
ncbi:MAG TPA: hypothetical protein DE315_02755 [Candidatus Omnitrophica bacterium]|nr:MAG: hypothetical protein A2Y05_03955 [Omnitrophica WOR_2 bacterium GWA2_53_43]HBO97494.1 hypothetical protein [Candidatus Omnitrophota bacterium]HCI44440.1 hypothetical protein [Candidatus Omnitrophota bacterium]